MGINEYQEILIKLTAQVKELKELDKANTKARKDKGVKRVKYDTKYSKQYISYMKRANRKGIAFDLTQETFDQMKQLECIYCGDTSTGIDRIDSNKGYVMDNIQPCCNTCNIMKFNYTENKFLRHVEKIYKHINYNKDE